MKFKTDDLVIITTGKDKGKEGKILKVLRNQNKVVVEGLNMRVRHIKATAQRPGEKVTFEAPIDASNVAIKDPKTGKPTRIGYKETGKNKVRFAKASGETLN
jgi:large subunit ribosomal protein L24